LIAKSQPLSLLASRLTDRDRQIALDCYEHRVLTSEQLRRLHFNNIDTARERLRELKQLHVLASFRPPQLGGGSAPHHWVLAEAGAAIAAAELDLERKQLGWQAQRALAIASSSKLAHQLAVNEFCTQLALDLRHADGRLERWWGERRARHLLDGLVNPDAYLRLHLPEGTTLELLLELDRATEDHPRLLDKARRYSKALRRTDLHAHVLLLVPSARRAENARTTITATGAPITTAVWSSQATRSPLHLVHELPLRPADHASSLDEAV
jgi:hypothetical protein